MFAKVERTRDTREVVYGSFDCLSVKGDTTPNASDFFYRNLVLIEFNDTGELVEKIDAMIENGASELLNECESRDGLFDDDALFLVYEVADLEQVARAATLASTIPSH